MERNDEIFKSNHHIALSSSLAIFGTLAATGCLELNEDHCVLKGGDMACGDDAGMCTMSLGTEREISANGCMAEKPEGFAHVQFGLPGSMGQEDDMGYRTVWGLLEGCDPTKALADAYIKLRAEVLDELDGRSRVRVGSVQIDESIIVQFNEALIEARVCASSSTGDTDETSSATSTTSMSDNSDSGTTNPSETATTGGGCTSSNECVDPRKPFCNEENGQCVSCNGMPEPDAACTEVDEMSPLCVGESCVPCTQVEPGVCDRQLLVCDSTTSICIPCTEHSQCASGACDIFVGTCFDPATRVEVGDGGPLTIGGGLEMLEGMWPDRLGSHRGVLVLHDEMTFDEAVTIMEAEAIAIIAAQEERPTWGHSVEMTVLGPPTITVTSPTRAYLDGVTLRDNTGGVNGWGVRCDGAQVDIRRSRVVANEGGGIEARDTCELHVENSFVGVVVNDREAISVAAGATTTILYSTLGAGFVNGVALHCEDMAVVEVRNSLMVSVSPNPEIDCTSTMPITSAWEAGGLDDMETNWFIHYSSGDYHLTEDAPEDIRVAVWQPGDPLTDIDGNLRVTAEGMHDHAGADVPVP